MEKVNLLLIDDDEDFRSRFIEYMVNDCINVSISTVKPENACKSLQSMNREDSDAVIVCENVLINIQDSLIPSGITVIVLRENYSEKMEPFDGFFYIDKYQSASGIVAGIADVCARCGVLIRRHRSSGEMSVVTVTSAAGGAGKTTFCLAFARLRKQLSRRNPLVIDMRSLSDHYLYFPEVDCRLHDDINMLLVDMENADSDPEKYLQRDRYGIAEFISPRNQGSGVIELDKNGMEKFLTIIRKWQLFDIVIFEMGDRLDETSSYIYESSDFIFSLSTQDGQGPAHVKKWEEMITRCSGKGKIVRIANFRGKNKEKNFIFTDIEETEAETEEILAEAFELPYDPDSFFRSEGKNEISMTGKYGKSMSVLAREVVKF